MSEPQVAERPGETPDAGPATQAGGAQAPPGRKAKRRTRVRSRRARTGITGVDRVNRVVLFLIGAGLIAAGTVALLSPQNVDLRQPRRLYADGARNIIDNPDLAFAITVAAAVVLFLLGLRWAWAQISPASGDGRISTTTVSRSPKGVTTVEPVSVARALAADLESVEGVHEANVRVIAMGSRPDLLATLEVRRDVALDTVRQAIEEPLSRFCASTGTEDVEAEIRIRFVDDTAPRVT